MLIETAPTTVDDLLAEVSADPWGQVAVSLYDTGRLVALAPWLTGHTARVDFLCSQQQPDGSWGGPDGYGWVPTLSATAGLLTELDRGNRPPPLAAAATRGLATLRRWLEPATALPVPDTIGVEFIAPALVEELQTLLARGQALPDLVGADLAWLRLPPGFDPRPLAAARTRFASGELPGKSWACLEVFGPAAVSAPFVRPADGIVGCSAAATAAWLGGPGGDPAARTALERLQARGGGPVPGVTPITYFEAAWVLNSLAIGGLTPPVPTTLLDRLAAGLTSDGAPAAPGLPADADDSAAVLSALLRHGRPQPPDCLLGYQADGYFYCFRDERNPSVSTNAHVLETLALYQERQPADADRFAGPAAMATRWLLSQQRPDGSWWDKWHASPYYATACCVIALALVGDEPARAAIDRAHRWLLDTQRPDGSWGRWRGSVEETAYAVQALTIDGTPRTDEPAAAAIRRGGTFLADPPPPAEQPPLWHAKDLYTPVAVVRAAQLAALRLSSRAARIPVQRRG